MKCVLPGRKAIASPNAAQGRIDSLDGLRGIAALSVFAVHFGQNTGVEWYFGAFDLRRLLENGELGVSLFFTLSGFLLGLPYIQALRGAREWPSPLRFARNRAARILPLYYVSLGIIVFVYGAWRAPGGWADIVLHAVFLFNYAEFSITSLNKPYWTLAVEMQFYLLLPFLFVAMRKAAAGTLFRQLCWIAGLSVAAYFAQIAVSDSFGKLIFWPGNPSLIWIRPNGAVVSQSLLAHLPHFLIGVGAAAIVASDAGEKLKKSRWTEAGFWIAAILIVGEAATGMLNDMTVPGGRYGLPVVPLLIGAVVLLAPGTRSARTLLNSGPLRGLGAISFGVYLLHLPCQYILVWQMREYGLDTQAWWWLFGISSLMMTVILAMASYYVLERPGMRAVRRF